MGLWEIHYLLKSRTQIEGLDRKNWEKLSLGFHVLIYPSADG